MEPQVRHKSEPPDYEFENRIGIGYTVQELFWIKKYNIFKIYFLNILRPRLLYLGLNKKLKKGFKFTTNFLINGIYRY